MAGYRVSCDGYNIVLLCEHNGAVILTQSYMVRFESIFIDYPWSCLDLS